MFNDIFFNVMTPLKSPPWFVPIHQLTWVRPCELFLMGPLPPLHVRLPVPPADSRAQLHLQTLFLEDKN